MTAEPMTRPIEPPDEAAKTGESSGKAIVGATLTFIALVALWELLVREFKVPGWILPAASAIALALAEWRGGLARHSPVTLYETIAGFALAIAISIPLAVAIVYAAILRNTIYPILLAFQSVRKVAIAPLLVLWIGFGMLPKVAETKQLEGALVTIASGREVPEWP